MHHRQNNDIKTSLAEVENNKTHFAEKGKNSGVAT
jgi:hypothetical protein